MNDFNLIRSRNMFSPTSDTFDTRRKLMPDFTVEPSRPNPGMFDFGEVPQADDTALQSLLAHIQAAPKREDYPNPLLQRILAGVAGVATGSMQGAQAGIGLNRALLDERYDRAVGDYDRKTGQLGTAASIGDKLYDNRAKRYSLILDTAKEAREARKADSEINVNNARVPQIQADTRLTGRRADVEGRDFERDNLTGAGWVVDLATGRRTNAGLFDPSFAQKSEADRLLRQTPTHSTSVSVVRNYEMNPNAQGENYLNSVRMLAAKYPQYRDFFTTDENGVVKGISDFEGSDGLFAKILGRMSKDEAIKIRENLLSEISSGQQQGRDTVTSPVVALTPETVGDPSKVVTPRVSPLGGAIKTETVTPVDVVNENGQSGKVPSDKLEAWLAANPNRRRK